MSKKKDNREDDVDLVEVAMIDLVPGNPNVMEPAKVDQLVASIQEHGWIQPVTVMPKDGGRYWLVDGEHRLEAAARLGMVAVPYALASFTKVEQVRAARLALNRIRGQVDLRAAAADLLVLEQAGWRPDDLLTCGFDAAEVSALLQQVNEIAVDVVDEAVGIEPEKSVETRRLYRLQLAFDDRDDRDRFKAALLGLGESPERGAIEMMRKIEARGQ